MALEEFKLPSTTTGNQGNQSDPNKGAGDGGAGNDGNDGGQSQGGNGNEGNEDEPIFNEAGDIVDKDGKVLKTKADIEKELEEFENNGGDGGDGGDGSDTKLTFEEIVKRTNIQPTDESGKPIVFEPTVEGITSYIEAAANHLANVKIGEVDSALVKTFPVLNDIIYHLKANNGDIKGFNFSVDYSKIDVNTLTDDGKIDLVVRDLMLKGETEAEAKSLAVLLKDSGKLNDRAKAAAANLKSYDDKVKAENRRIVNERVEQEKRDLDNYWNNIKDSILNKKQILDIKLPTVIKVKTDNGGFVDKTPQDFYEYVSKPVKTIKLQDGKQVKVSQWQLDSISQREKRTHENDMYDALMLFTKGDVSSIVKNIANTTVANEIRAKYMEMQKRKASAGSGGGQSANKGGNIILPVTTK